MTRRPYVVLMDPNYGIRFYRNKADAFNDKELARQGIKVLFARELTDEEWEEYRMGRVTSEALAVNKVER